MTFKVGIKLTETRHYDKHMRTYYEIVLTLCTVRTFINIWLKNGILNVRRLVITNPSWVCIFLLYNSRKIENVFILPWLVNVWNWLDLLFVYSYLFIFLFRREASVSGQQNGFFSIILYDKARLSNKSYLIIYVIWCQKLLETNMINHMSKQFLIFKQSQ